MQKLGRHSINLVGYEPFIYQFANFEATSSCLVTRIFHKDVAEEEMAFLGSVKRECDIRNRKNRETFAKICLHLVWLLFGRMLLVRIFSYQVEPKVREVSCWRALFVSIERIILGQLLF